MDQTKIDSIKAITTYATMAVVVIGGMVSIVLLNMDPDKLAIIAGLVGAGLAFLSNGETATRTARATIAAQNGKSAREIHDQMAGT